MRVDHERRGLLALMGAALLAPFAWLSRPVPAAPPDRPTGGFFGFGVGKAVGPITGFAGGCPGRGEVELWQVTASQRLAPTTTRLAVTNAFYVPILAGTPVHVACDVHGTWWITAADCLARADWPAAEPRTA